MSREPDLIFDGSVPENVKELILAVGGFEQHFIGTTILEMVEHDVVKARQSVRDRLAEHLGYKFSYIESNTVILEPLQKEQHE